MSTTSAAARAASVAPDTAIPQSAFFSAGASFTPSPVMPTMWPRLCRISTIWNLCSGNTWAKPSAVSMASSRWRRIVVVRLAEDAGVEDVRSEPQLSGDFLADGDLIARDHLHAYAHLPGRLDGRLGVLPGRVEKRQNAEELPLAVGVRPGDAQRTEAACGKCVDGLVHIGLYLRGIGRQLQDHLGRAFGYLERRSVRAVTVASVRLWTGSKGWKWTHL